MPDISMCHGWKGMELCDNCYRRTARPSKNQCYAAFKAEKLDDGTEFCEGFMLVRTAKATKENKG